MKTGVVLVLCLGAASASAQVIRIADESVSAPPDEYIVEEGDTLWDICDRFFKQPWSWPTVWAMNPHITNPHWIYQGDVLRLRLRGDQRPEAAIQRNSYIVGSAGASHYGVQKGFITEKPLDDLGSIRWSFEEVEHLSQDNQVYIEFRDLERVRPTDQYTVYRVVNDVLHPKTGKMIGQKIQVLGIVEVRRVDQKVATAEIIRSFSEITRGAKITELLDHYHLVSPRVNLIDLEATIVDNYDEIAELGEFHQVYIDRGAKDGVQVGNRFFVLRRDDGFLQLRTDWEGGIRKDLPWEQLGEVLVVETKDRTATAIVTRSARELHIGDRLQMQRQY